MANKLAFGTGKSIVIEECQICGNKELEPILFLGFLSPVDQMKKVTEKVEEQISYPGQILYCPVCHLVQIGLIIDAKIVFPPEYPYTSSTTKNIRDNFKELYDECKTIVDLKDDLVIDIGSNDGNLLSNFTKHRVLGITPEDVGRVAIEKGIPTVIDFFNKETVDKVKKEYGKAKVITATNVFAHIEDVNGIVELVIELLEDKGVFIVEVDYLLRIIEELQYDTMHHEHLMYYSLYSIKYLLEKHGLEVIHAKEIPTHGGSFRIYSSRKGKYKVRDSVKDMLENEKGIDKEKLLEFAKRVEISKLELYSLLLDIKKNNGRIYGIGAPGRAVTLINYVGIDDGIMDCAVEIKGSNKIGKYIPGTIIPVVEETKLFEDQPEYALMLSWHIGKEIAVKLREKGFKGKFIVPLPKPRIL